MLDFIRNLPFGTRILFYIMIILHILKFAAFDRSFVNYITISPKLVMDGEVWRIITAPFFHGDILHIAMNMLTFTQLGVTFERTVGTCSFFYHVFIFAILSNILYILIAGFMYIGGRLNEWTGSAIGFSGVLFCLMVIDNAASGGSERSVFGLFLVPTEYYPWVMLVLTSLILPHVSLLGHASGLIIGLIYQSGVLNWIIPSSSFFISLERKLCGCCIQSNGYIASDGERQAPPAPYALFNNAFGDTEPEEPEQQQENTHEQFRGRGRSLGDIENTTWNGAD